VTCDTSQIPHALAALLIGFDPFLASFVWVTAIYELGNGAMATHDLDPNLLFAFLFVMVGIAWSCLPRYS
jgi:hypothetical protein